MKVAIKTGQQVTFYNRAGQPVTGTVVSVDTMTATRQTFVTIRTSYAGQEYMSRQPLHAVTVK